jgi:hypothetical protein
VLDRINPSSEGVVRWVRSVDLEQPGLPGGLRARIQPDYVPPEHIIVLPAAVGEGETP